MEDEIDNWVNHDFWYANQYIDHYDRGFGMPVPGDESGSIAKSSAIESYCSPPHLPRTSIDSNVFITNGENAQYSSIPTLKVEAESPANSLYMVQNEPNIFVPSPTIPLQNRTCDSGEDVRKLYYLYFFSLIVLQWN